MAEIFTVTLTGGQETPPVHTAASGAGMVIWDAAALTAAYEITIWGLDFGPALGIAPQTETTTDDVTAMHVHSAVPHIAGGVVLGLIGPAQDDDLSVELNEDGSWTVRGVWDAEDLSNAPISNFAEALNATAADSDAPLYFNVHTGPFPAGEIRGQWVAALDHGDHHHHHHHHHQHELWLTDALDHGDHHHHHHHHHRHHHELRLTDALDHSGNHHGPLSAALSHATSDWHL